MVSVAVAFSNEQAALIQELWPEIEAGNHRVWSIDRVKELRYSIKSHVIGAQSSKCGYCDRHLGSESHKAWETDHVVARSTHPQFTFEPANLVGCCAECNQEKGSARTLKNNARKTYPKTSDGFLIIHPQFDDFADHVLRLGWIYVGKTEKGSRTIYICNLLRFAQKYIDWTNPIGDRRFENEVTEILNGGPQAAATALALLKSVQLDR